MLSSVKHRLSKRGLRTARLILRPEEALRRGTLCGGGFATVTVSGTRRRVCRMSGAAHFDGRAADYARARPLYPAALWERVQETGLLEPGRRAVDLGAGTGQATGPLLTAGLDVVAVEPGPNLAVLLQQSYPQARVVVATAEDVPLEADSFDLAVVATAVHWMDLGIVLPKVHRALREDGRLLVWRNVFGDPAAPTTPFRERVAEIVRRRPTPPRPGDAEDAPATARSLTRSGLFRVEDMSGFRWDVQLDDDQVRLLFSTFSDWSPAEVNEAAAAVRELGGSVVEHYSSWLIIAEPHRPKRGAVDLR